MPLLTPTGGWHHILGPGMIVSGIVGMVIAVLAHCAVTMINADACLLNAGEIARPTTRQVLAIKSRTFMPCVC